MILPAVVGYLDASRHGWYLWTAEMGRPVPPPPRLMEPSRRPPPTPVVFVVKRRL